MEHNAFAEVFIVECFESGITKKSDILEEFVESDGGIDNIEESEVGRTVKRKIENRESEAYNAYWEIHECDECDIDMLYDESKEEYYCPICQ